MKKVLDSVCNVQKNSKQKIGLGRQLWRLFFITYIIPVVVLGVILTIVLLINLVTSTYQ
jgi:hypothetical protein